MMSELFLVVAGVAGPLAVLVVVGLLIGWHDERYGSDAFRRLQSERTRQCN